MLSSKQFAYQNINPWILERKKHDALIKIEEVLARDPDFAEALFLKAQILWEGFEDCKAARECLLKIIAVEPVEKTVFRRWALNFYEELSNGHGPVFAQGFRLRRDYAGTVEKAQIAARKMTLR
jgi:hypothetical protein